MENLLVLHFGCYLLSQIVFCFWFPYILFFVLQFISITWGFSEWQHRRIFVGKTVLMDKVSIFSLSCRFKAIISAVFRESGLLSFTAVILNLFSLEHFVCHVMHAVHCATAFMCSSPCLGGINVFSYSIKNLTSCQLVQKNEVVIM